MKKILKNKKAFTLTELIVVIAIIGILAAVLIPSLTGYIQKAKESTALQEAAPVVTAYETWLIECAKDSTTEKFEIYVNKILFNIADKTQYKVKVIEETDQIYFTYIASNELKVKLTKTSDEKHLIAEILA